MTARFEGEPPELFADTLDVTSFAARLKGSEGPARLAVELHDALRHRVDGVSDDLLGLHELLEERQGVRHIVWMTEAEAEAFPL